MSISHNATKKMCNAYGISRISNDFTFKLQSHIDSFLERLVEKTLLLVEYSGKKTINPKDIIFLSQFDPTIPNTVWTGTITNFYYSKNSFQQKIRDIVKEFRTGEFQISPSSFDLFQAITEKKIGNKIAQIKGNLIIESRQTVYARDLD